jgi:uncharacterized protein (DUF1330 family)
MSDRRARWAAAAEGPWPYLIADVVAVDDADAYEAYKPLVPPTLEAFGARYLARSGAVTLLEGDWRPSRVVVVRFDSASRAKEWWSSPIYAEAKRARHRAASTNMIVVEGT